MIKRIFYPGEEWVYIKIYMNVMNSDEFILKVIDSYMSILGNKSMVSDWFFVRYYDPDFHLRLRLKLIDPSNLNYILSVLNKKIKKYSFDFIYKIELSTYVREIERYGKNRILTTESVFSVDSTTVLKLIKLSEITGFSRWKIAILLINCIFKEWGFTLEYRYVCMKKLSDYFKLEFGYDMYNSKSLNKIYAQYKKDIESLLLKPRTDNVLNKIEDILFARFSEMNLLIKSNRNFKKKDICSYIHMSMNRLFKLNNRTYELVLYEVLKRVYKSLLIRREEYDENHILMIELFFSSEE